MKNTSFESAKNSSSFASTTSAAQKNVSLNGRYSSMEEFIEKLSTEMLFHRYVHAIEWQNTARSSRVLVSVEAQNSYNSCESWNVEVDGLNHNFGVEDLARAYVMACGLLRQNGLSHNCQLRGVAVVSLPRVREEIRLESLTGTFKVNVHNSIYGYSTAVICENHEGDFVGSCVTTRYSDGCDTTEYGAFIGSIKECMEYCRHNSLRYSVQE